MKTTSKLLTVTAVLSAAWLWAPAQASAAPGGRKSVLEGEPIVRSKLQLRKFRFQLTPYVGMSLSQPFVHMGYVGARAGFHFADWIGARAGFGYGVVNVDSALLRAVNGGGLPVGVAPGQTDTMVTNATPCPTEPNGGAPCRRAAEIDNPAPLLHDFQAGLTRAQWQASVDAVFTPFSGKLGLFSAAFTNYDIYLFGGLGLVGYGKHTDERSTADRLGLSTDPENPMFCSSQLTGQNDECILHPVAADTGVKIGFSFGGGVNLFASNFVSINLEVQDIVTSNNLAGLNTTVEDIPPLVDRNDKDVFHNVTLQIGATFYIPFKAKRTK
jgi:outer membrane beta-barrel protein